LKKRIGLVLVLGIGAIGSALVLFRGGHLDSEKEKPNVAGAAPHREARPPRTPTSALPAYVATPPAAPGVEPPSPLPYVSYGRPEEAMPIQVAPSFEALVERDERLTALRETGPGGGDWRDHFEDVKSEWQRIAAHEHIDVPIGAWECSAGGCAITLEFEAVEDLETFSSVAITGISMKRWKGAAFRSGPIEASGNKIAATWIFYAPRQAGSGSVSGRTERLL